MLIFSPGAVLFAMGVSLVREASAADLAGIDDGFVLPAMVT